VGALINPDFNPQPLYPNSKSHFPASDRGIFELDPIRRQYFTQVHAVVPRVSTAKTPDHQHVQMPRSVSFHPEMALFRNLCVNLLVSLCDAYEYVSA